MRIINTDILLKNLEWLDEYDSYILHSVKIAIDKTPTVKAIPIEWLESQLNVFGDGFYNLKLVIKQWEKENEANVEC